MLRLLLMIVLIGLCVPHAVYASSDIHKWASAEDKLLTTWSKQLDQWIKRTPEQEVITARLNQVIDIRGKAEKCETDISGELQGLKGKTEALGENTKSDGSVSQEIIHKRRGLSAQQTILERDLALCRLLAVNARELRDKLKIIRQQAFSQVLLEQQQPVWGVLPEVIKQLSAITLPQSPFFTWRAIIGGMVAAAFLLPLSFFFARILKNRYVTLDSKTRRSKLSAMYAVRLPWVALFASLGVVAVVGNISAAIMICFVLVISFVLAPLLDWLVCHPKLKCAAGKAARILFDLSLLGTAWLLMGFSQAIPTQIDTLVRALFMLLLAWSAAWLVWKLSSRGEFQTLANLKLPLVILLLSGPFSYWYGYRALGEFLVLGIYGSLTGILVAWLLYLAAKGGFVALEDPNNTNTVKIRRYLGYQSSQKIPGLGLIKISFGFVVFVSMIYWLLIVWQVSDAEKALLSELVQQGFNVGVVNIVPAKIIAAIFSLIILITFAQWFRKQLDERWLSKAKMDAGVRQSIVSLTSYAITGIAIAIALSMTGVDLQNIAIIAGALSVGIGFGLQNIVNNFVSGLILLLERPVRPGDWIVVGGTEGYVKKISIRSTLIQTFDRADVLVPNSELISNQVTNWVLRDLIGRVIVPVGVAYGSDTEKVKKLLLEIARKHDMVINSERVCPVPDVFFINFGDSSLNFELRCMIQDVGSRFQVRSDLLFAIDKAFREENIEIPFPQRVLHMTHGE